MKTLLAILLIMSVPAFADQLTIIVQEQQSTTIDAFTQSTNTTYTYSFSAPQTVGQLQDSISFTQTNPPASSTVSNAIVPRVAAMMGWIKVPTNTTINVVLPQ